MRGEAYWLGGSIEPAVANYARALEVDPSIVSKIAPLAPAFGERGSAFLKIGDRDRAIADFKTALQLGEKQAADELRKLGVRP